MRCQSCNYSELRSKVGSAPDKDGKHVWSNGFGATTAMTGLSVADVATDSAGNAVIVGSFHGNIDFGGGVIVNAGDDDVFIAKFDPMGKLLWTQAYGDKGYEFATSVAIDGAGRIVVTGSFNGALTLGNGIPNAGGGSFVVRLDPAGKTLWARVFGKTANVDVGAVALSGKEDMIVAGSFKAMSSPADLGGGPIPSPGNPSLLLGKFHVP